MPDDIEPFSPDDVLSGRYLPPEMMRDLQIVAGLDTAAVEQFSDALDHEPGVLTSERLLELAKEQFEEDSIAEAVTRTVQNIRPRDTRQVLFLVNRWRTTNEERSRLIPDEHFSSLAKNVELLAKEHSALELMRKSQRLLTDTGNEIQSALAICDLRPVFDEAHEKIEGFVALATLCIRYIRQNGERDVFEVCLTEEELSSLMETANDALKKLHVMKSLVHPRGK